jgi:hypothetical protein
MSHRGDGDARLRRRGEIDGGAGGRPAPAGQPRALRGSALAPVHAGAAPTNTILVGHAYPFYSLVGAQYLDEGEAAVVRPGGSGFEVVARVGVTQWRDLATEPASR